MGTLLPDSYDCECFSGFVKKVMYDPGRVDTYPNYFAYASSTEVGHSPAMAFDTKRATCWKPKRLEGTHLVGEWQSALRVTFPKVFNKVSKTVVGGVKIG